MKKFPSYHTIKITCVLAAIIFTANLNYGQTNAWKGLVPLRSTRADVEKLLGKPTEKSYLYDAEYKTQTEHISVEYADRKCDAGWNVEKDTLLQIHVLSRTFAGKSFDDLNLDKSKFNYTVDDAVFGTWTNVDDGISYYFANVDRELQFITYLPRRTDNKLRCDGFPPMPEISHYPFDSSVFYKPSLSAEDNLERIFNIATNFFFQLKKYKEKYKGYILVYFDNKSPIKKQRKQLAELSRIIYKLRKLSTDELMIIEGGLRNESQIELYMLPKEWKPPSPDPTLPSPQFMKKKINLKP